MKLKKLVLLLASVGVLGACEAATQTVNNNQDDSATIKLGGNWELSGDVSAYGVVQNNAIKMAVQEQNDRGGIDGKPVEYIEFDNKSAPEESANGATRLTDVENVSVILGPATTGSVSAQTPLATNATTPVITATATGDGITLDHTGEVLEYIYRVCFQDSFQGVALARFANQQGWKKGAVIMDNSSDYGQNLSREFTENFTGDIVANESYVSKETDFTTILTNVKSKGAEFIFVAGYYQEAGPLIKQAREMGIDAAILGPDGFGNQEIISLAGPENMNNIYYSAHFVQGKDMTPKAQAFVDKYRQTYGEDPDMFAALAYDAAYLAFDAIDRADSANRQAITDQLAQTTNFEGVTGTFSFDEQHNPIKTAYIQEIQQGQVAGTTVIEP
ncbi:branched-chain amino acid ABC transporter substrate-binding protein [Aerococcus urinaehominis]|uniref:Branched-chain amino acid ABC transporter substrate-binding protein n=1 Tax=Aerococcus urinaehominis TaxID=128944 RepID=A0A0X8FLC8_9LACT|nr:ABC transporter substrate-binding protein [Aerococcus urinaehominis]AMB99448.1 branched-chain amino acid ABC transporter substrate-binding protein [Aerococcus urinaehominis]SDM28645.1 amino acid/amide ABC transporter substrate-binding protein, HAAT family (TC 3.A.1.4.-) [Aerococcus urinaehominis]